MYLGIDAGASTTKALIVNEEGKVASYFITPSGMDFRASYEKCLCSVLQTSGLNLGAIQYSVSTGYGRALINADSQSSEIVCISRGVHKLLPSVRTVIDVGGQDSKAIRVDGDGRVVNFAMNDKCAAGTGRFLEVMANIIGKPVSQLAEVHRRSSRPVEISSTCTVFAESEVVSHISQGARVEDVVAGLHQAMAERVYVMANRVGFEREVAFTGGVAKNRGFVSALDKKIGCGTVIPEEPQIMGALGAALSAIKRYRKEVHPDPHHRSNGKI